MLGVQGRGIRTFGEYVSKENVKAFIQPIAIPYNLNENMQTGVIVPFVHKNPKNEAFDPRSGFGDISIFYKYEVLQKDRKAKTLRTLIKARQKFPTGESERTPSLGADEYQTQISAISGFITTNYAFYAEAGYNTFFKNIEGHNINYNIAIGLPLLPQKYPPDQINVYLEVNGNYSIENGLHERFLSPAFQYIPGKKLLLETGVQLPIKDEKAKGKKTDFIFTLGGRFLIF
ncbi:MAG: hypothetical protein ABEH43_08600 [Flavobacteriales bacterium]